MIRKKKYEQLKKEVLRWIEEDKETMALLCSELVKCNTADPPGDTRDAMVVVERFMAEAGLSYKTLGVDETLPNMLASVQFSDRGRHLMFNGHLDTMPAGKEPGWNDNPWSGKITDGKVWGRGTADMKGGVTAMLFAYKYIVRLGEYLSGKVSLSLVSDEETGYGRGTGYLFEQLPDEMMADAVLSAEPSGTGAVSFASKGYIQFTVRVETRGAIAGYSNESKNAVRLATDIIRELDAIKEIEVELPDSLASLFADEEWVKCHTQLRGEGHAELLARITADVCTIKGGSLQSVTAPDCEFSVAVVIPVGTDPYAVYKKVEEVIARYPEATLYWEGIDVADVCSPTTDFAALIQDTAEELNGLRPVMTPDIAISDCRYWRYRGIPAYWYGPDSSLCSAANEHISLNELFHVVATHTLTALKYLLPKAGKRIRLDSQCYLSSLSSSSAEIKSLPAQRIAYTRHSTQSFIEKALTPIIERGLCELYTTLCTQGVTLGAVGMAIYEWDGRALSVITAYPVPSMVQAGENYDVMILEEVREAAVTIHRGSLKTCTRSWSALATWLKAQGKKAAGQYREVYILGGIILSLSGLPSYSYRLTPLRLPHHHSNLYSIHTLLRCLSLSEIGTFLVFRVLGFALSLIPLSST